LVLPVALAVFLHLPRRAPVRVAEVEGRVGLTDEVRLDTPPVLRDDPTEVARVRFLDGPAEPVVLRGAVLGDFDGQRWSSLLPLRPTPTFATEPGRRVEVSHAALGSVVLAPGRVVRFDGATFNQDVGDGWHGTRGEAVRYT